MNKGRKVETPLHSNSFTNIKENYSSPKNESAQHKLLTPCRRLGLNKKKKNLTLTPTSNDVIINSANNSTSDVKINETEPLLDERTGPNNMNCESSTPVIKKNLRQKKIGLKARKRSYTEINSKGNDPSSLHINKQDTNLKTNDNQNITTPLSIILTRCDMEISSRVNSNCETTDETNLLSQEITVFNTQISEYENSLPRQENERFENIPSTAFDTKKETLEQQEKQNEDKNETKLLNNNDLTNTKENIGQSNKKNKSSEKRFENDPLTDSDEMSDFNVTVSRRRKKKTLSIYKKSPKPSTSKQKENVSNSQGTSYKQYNSDSDDDFVKKPRLEQKVPEEKKKININKIDPLIRTEHIRLGENKSYTIMHKGNVSSYVKSYDNDVSLKITESDDNQQSSSQQSNLFQAKKSMIIERKDYLIHESNEKIDSMFDIVLENMEKYKPDQTSENNSKELVNRIKNLHNLKNSIMSRIKTKRDKLDSLKRITVYKKEHNLEQLKATTLQIKRALQEALVDLLYILKNQTAGNFSMTSLMGFCKVPYTLVGYNEGEDRFE